MRIEVDQSIKIERTNKDTHIGVANKKVKFSALISRQTKRVLEKEFRKADRGRLFVYRTFISGVVLALQHAGWKNISDVVIDVEYSGQDRLLRSIFLEMWSRFSDTVPDVSFQQIGKRSPAHQVCYAAMKKERKPDVVLTLAELRRLAL